MADDLALTGVTAVPSGRGYDGASPSPSEKPGRGATDRSAKASSSGDGVELSPEARKKVLELAQADQEVRAHEAAHMAAGGGLVRGGASFSFERGPDGKNYAVAGEVSLDTSAVPNNPAATLQKAEQIKAAALAPASPSPQDQKVAAEAGAMAVKAAAELARKAQGASRSVGTRLNVLA